MTEEVRFSERLRGYGPVGIAAIVIIVTAGVVVGPLAAILVIGWALLAKVPGAELGFAPPRRWLLIIVGGAVSGVLLKLLLKAIIMPLLAPPAVNSPYHFVTGNLPALLRMIATMVIIAGLGEEILYRGYLFERFRGLLGTRPWATASIVAITTCLFALAHLSDQGLPGAEQAAITGFTFALLYVFSGSLWLSMIAHASFDIAALLLIYFDLEGAAARTVFG